LLSPKQTEREYETICIKLSSAKSQKSSCAGQINQKLLKIEKQRFDTHYTRCHALKGQKSVRLLLSVRLEVGQVYSWMDGFRMGEYHFRFESFHLAKGQ
jgi:hypothetical protein